uniref:Ethylene-overproduction protein 1-like isoform X3 n=1 Tax=Rhizophora mucronata TaxID=61149 RepID=A0A2P2KZU1_RHIMU
MHHQSQRPMKPNEHHKLTSSPHSKTYWQRKVIPRQFLDYTNQLFRSYYTLPQLSFPPQIYHSLKNQSYPFLIPQSCHTALPSMGLIEQQF